MNISLNTSEISQCNNGINALCLYNEYIFKYLPPPVKDTFDASSVFVFPRTLRFAVDAKWTVAIASHLLRLKALYKSVFNQNSQSGIRQNHACSRGQRHSFGSYFAVQNLAEVEVISGMWWGSWLLRPWGHINPPTGLDIIWLALVTGYITYITYIYSLTFFTHTKCSKTKHNEMTKTLLCLTFT